MQLSLTSNIETIKAERPASEIAFKLFYLPSNATLKMLCHCL